MSGHWQSGSVATRKAAVAFDRLMTAQAALTPSASRRPVGPRDLIAYVGGDDDGRAAEVEAAMAADPRLRADLDHLLRRMAVLSLPRLAAASSGGVGQRTGEGCRIVLKQSRADASQVYVLIEFDDPALTPRALFVCSRHRSHVRHPLPDAQGQTIQLLVDDGSELLAALQDVDAEVFLR